MTLLALRDAGEPLAAAAFMLSPLADMIHFDDVDPMCSLKSIKIFADYYFDSRIQPPR